MNYPQLFTLMKRLRSINHGNSVPERGFSANKHLLDMHGSSTGNDTVILLQLVKDDIVSVAGVTNVSIKKQVNSFVFYDMSVT